MLACLAGDEMDIRHGYVEASHSLNRYGNAGVPNGWTRWIYQKQR